MDKDALISEICRRVQLKIQAAESGETAEGQTTDGQKPLILILTPEHGTACHEMLENRELAECYGTECALLKEYQCRPEDYEAVIAFGMSCEALGKIAHGIFDSGYTRLFGQALLAGKKIYLAEEEIELFRYKDTAPKAYYGCLEDSLNMLRCSGVVTAPQAQIPNLILHGEPKKDTVAPAAAPAAKADGPVPGERPGKEAVLDKKVITEKDMIALGNDRVKRVTIGEKAILTDLAKEYASKHRIEILRRGTSSGKERSL